MKVAVTGHTQGIGKDVYDGFHDAIGFSRNNGYDIMTHMGRADIVGMCYDCDIIINNAHHGFAQVELLYDLAKEYGKDKTIINISSNSGDGIKKKEHMYAIHKSALDKASEQLFYLGYDVTNIRLGWVDTHRVSHKDVDKINPSYVSDLIDWIIQQPYRVKEITITP